MQAAAYCMGIFWRLQKNNRVAHVVRNGIGKTGKTGLKSA
jgi:hypothetical protein